MLLASEIREFDSYTDMAVTHQKDVDQFPMCFSIGKKNTYEVLDELEKSLGTRNLDEVMRTPYGGVILKRDYDSFLHMFAHHDREKKHFESSQRNLINAIKAEMYNHEYAYTREPEDTLSALGRDADAFSDERFSKAWKQAEKIVLGKAS